MLELLAQYSDSSQFFNLFNYITFRTGGAMFTAMVFAFAFGAPFIHWLRKKQGKGQPIREDGPQTHFAKRGKPGGGWKPLKQSGDGPFASLAPPRRVRQAASDFNAHHKCQFWRSLSGE